MLVIIIHTESDVVKTRFVVQLHGTILPVFFLFLFLFLTEHYQLCMLACLISPCRHYLKNIIHMRKKMRGRRFKPVPDSAVIMSTGLIPLSGSRNLVCARRLGIFASVPSSTALLFTPPGPEQVSRLPRDNK